MNEIYNLDMNKKKIWVSFLGEIKWNTGFYQLISDQRRRYHDI